MAEAPRPQAVASISYPRLAALAPFPTSNGDPIGSLRTDSPYLRRRPQIQFVREDEVYRGSPLGRSYRRRQDDVFDFSGESEFEDDSDYSNESEFEDGSSVYSSCSDDLFFDREEHCPQHVCRECDSSAEVCSICLDNFSTGEFIRKVNVCGHQFHSACLDQWLARHARCPNCRRDVRSTSKSN